HARGLAFEVRGHRDHRADRDHAGAADAGDEKVPRPVPMVSRRLGQSQHLRDERVLRARQHTALLAQRPAAHAHQARAEALRARVVLVAAGLVDAALAAKRGLVRQYRHAVALHAAVAAAFADRLVDEQALRRIGELALLAAPALLGGAGLLVD